MRVLIVSKFLHHVGGVETYLRWQANALAAAGHEVALLGMTPPPGEALMSFPDNAPVYLTPYRSFDADAPNRVRSAAASVYSPGVARDLRRAIDEFSPDVVHFHGTCYQLTPSVFRAAARSSAKVVLTAHEYKLVCANQRLLDDRAHEVCTECVEKSTAAKSLTIIRHSCIKGARGPSVLGALEMPLAGQFWRSTNGVVLAPSGFMADTIIRDGKSGDVRHLRYPWPELGAPTDTPRDSVLFMGRLSREKGVEVALAAWRDAASKLPTHRLRIAGRGVEEAKLRAQVDRDGIARVDFVGFLDEAGVLAELSRAAVTLHPSTWHDNSPLSVHESICAGVPAIVSDMGGMPEIVEAGRGSVVPVRDAPALAIALEATVQAGQAGTQDYLDLVRAGWFSPDDHLAALMDVYAEQ